jgi:hypothetical protein
VIDDAIRPRNPLHEAPLITLRNEGIGIAPDEQHGHRDAIDFIDEVVLRQFGERGSPDGRRRSQALVDHRFEQSGRDRSGDRVAWNASAISLGTVLPIVMIVDSMNSSSPGLSAKPANAPAATTPRTSSGRSIASRSATAAPIEWPTTVRAGSESCVARSATSSAKSRIR